MLSNIAILVGLVVLFAHVRKVYLVYKHSKHTKHRYPATPSNSDLFVRECLTEGVL